MNHLLEHVREGKLDVPRSQFSRIGRAEPNVLGSSDQAATAVPPMITRYPQASPRCVIGPPRFRPALHLVLGPLTLDRTFERFSPTTNEGSSVGCGDPLLVDLGFASGQGKAVRNATRSYLQKWLQQQLQGDDQKQISARRPDSWLQTDSPCLTPPQPPSEKLFHVVLHVVVRACVIARNTANWRARYSQSSSNRSKTVSVDETAQSSGPTTVDSCGLVPASGAFKNWCAADRSGSPIKFLAHPNQLGLGLNVQLRVCVSNMSFDSSFPNVQYATNVRRRMPSRR